MLERRVDVFVQVLARQPTQTRPHRRGVLAVGLVESVGNEWSPRGPALRHHHPQARVTVEDTRGDELAHCALTAVRRLHVVEQRTAGPAEVATVEARGVVRLGADVEGDDEAGLRHRRPDRLPHLVVPVVDAEARRDREVPGLEAHVGGACDLRDGVVGVEQRDRGGAHVTGAEPLELDGPVVDGRAARRQQLRITDRRHPDADRRVHQLGPDPFAIEVGEAEPHVVGARRPLVDGPARLVGEHVGPRHPPAELLTVDAHRLVAAVGVLDAARHPLGEVRGQGRGEEVVGLDEVRVGGVCPELHDGLTSQPAGNGACSSLRSRARRRSRPCRRSGRRPGRSR